MEWQCPECLKWAPEGDFKDMGYCCDLCFEELGFVCPYCLEWSDRPDIKERENV